jgi:hypothetical protein
MALRLCWWHNLSGEAMQARRLRFLLSLAAGLLFSGSSFSQSPYANLWLLDGVTFNDGYALTGSLTYDRSTGPFGTFATATRGPGGADFPHLTSYFGTGIGSYGTTGEAHPTVANTAVAFSPTVVEFSYVYLGTPLAVLHLEFAGQLDPYDPKGRQIDLLASSYERRYLSDGSLFLDRAITGGQVVSAIPEPETYAMLLAGLVLLGVHAHRRKKARGVQALPLAAT